ncbi:MAG: glycogen debranching N-terminal domain-containing protein, partial [Stellaceae bacterium]
MTDLNRLRPMPSHLILHRGHAVAVADRAGSIASGTEGFYYRQTRFLCKMRVCVNARPPRNVCAVAVNPASSIAYYLAPSPAGDEGGPEPGREGSGGEIVQHGIEIQVNRSLDEVLHHDIYVTNHALAAATVVICWEFDADFADRSEAAAGERQQDAPVERAWRTEPEGGVLALHYRHPQLNHAVEIRLSGPSAFFEQDGAVCCRLTLPPQQPAGLAIDVSPIFCCRRAALPQDVAGAEGLRLTTPHGLVQRAWDRAVSDLAALALLDGEGDEKRTPAGGIPNYVALFGRDTLMTGFQASLLGPEMLRGTLSLIAKWNADRYNERFDEEPGRVIHQRQLGPLSLLEKNPFLHYYGDYSAPGLFLIDLAWHLAVTGDKQFFLSMRDKMLATLEWMDRDGDRDHDGFYEYATKAGAWGEKNQGWKDSGEAVLYADGHMVEDPIAIVEIQGCYYAAKQLLGLAFASIGEDRRAAGLLAEAAELKRRFNQTFWMPEERYFALALEPAKNPVRTIASDPGQCLGYGIVDDDKAEAVAERLMAPDMFSGWGVRTLSARHPAFNPLAYHLGSVWPASNGLIGFGLKRYGFDAQLHRLARGMFAASRLFEHDRLPEAFGGQPRDPRHPHPGIYPGANSPQAWSAGAVVLLVQSMLGLLPLAPRETLIVDPDLPEWLPELSLANLRIGAARVGLRFRRDQSGYTHHEIVDQEGR